MDAIVDRSALDQSMGHASPSRTEIEKFHIVVGTDQYGREYYFVFATHCAVLSRRFSKQSAVANQIHKLLAVASHIKAARMVLEDGHHSILVTIPTTQAAVDKLKGEVPGEFPRRRGYSQTTGKMCEDARLMRFSMLEEKNPDRGSGEGGYLFHCLSPIEQRAIKKLLQ